MRLRLLQYLRQSVSVMGKNNRNQRGRVMRKIVICDDNSAILKELKSQVIQCIEEPVQVEVFSEPEEMKRYIQSGARVDILLLDIILEDEDGIMLAKEIRDGWPDIRIVFITGYLEQAKRVFLAGPVYFLIKPISQENLKQVLENVLLEMKKDEKQYITLQTKNGIYKVDLKEIFYIESRVRVLLVHMDRGIETVYMKMDDFAEMLPDTYLRVHKSFLVNMDRICHFSSKDVELENDERIPVSRTCYKEAKIRFLEYCGNRLME